MSSIVNFFFKLTCNLKLYHWQTKSFARHTAADKLFEKVVDISDQFMESYMGRYGRPNMAKKDLGVTINEYDDKEFVGYLKTCLTYLEGPLTRALQDSDTDLITIKDDLITEISRALYLMTLQ